VNGFFAIALAFVLPLAPSLYGIYREPLRFELRQVLIACVTALQKISFIAAIYFLSKTQAGAIQPVSVAILVLAAVFALVWSVTARRALALKAISGTGLGQVWEALPGIQKALIGTVIWMHINGALTGAVQTLDVYFLSHNKVPLSEIALYSLALKAANFFQIAIIPFSQVLGVYFASKVDYRNPAQVRGALVIGTALFAVVAAAVFGAGHVLAEPILVFLAKGKFAAPEIARGVEYFRWLLGGICVLSLCYVQGIYLNNRGKLKVMTMAIFAPWFVVSAAGYYWASQQSALTAAKFNVPVYALCTLGLHIYAYIVYRKDRKPN
jgi:O-antigen/teichoic acid export membrane protein